MPRLGGNDDHDVPLLRTEIKPAEADVIDAIFKRLAPDPLMQGNIARAAYPAASWTDALAAQFRNTKQERDADDPGVLSKIAKMLVASLKQDRTRHLSVLSFNYDSMLDDAVIKELNGEKLDTSLQKSVKDGETFEQSWMDAGIYIYHLHGYLETAQPEPILDGDSYVPVLRGDHWSWRCMERALTSGGNASLFIGLSLADPSLSYVLERWKSWQTPLVGVYLAPPPILPFVKQGDPRTVALIYRSIMDLYSSVLDRLHLICYHLSSWREIDAILNFVGGSE